MTRTRAGRRRSARSPPAAGDAVEPRSMTRADGTVRLGVIGGTGTDALLAGGRAVSVETPFGAIGATVGQLGGTPAAMVLRHGAGHGALPHQVNYRGLVWALRQLG